MNDTEYLSEIKVKDESDYEWTKKRVKSMILGSIRNGRRKEAEMLGEYVDECSGEEKKYAIYAEKMWESKFDIRPNIKDIDHAKEILSKDINRIFSGNVQDIDKKSRNLEESLNTGEKHMDLRIPFSWFKEIKKEFHGNEISYLEAIVALAYVVFCYRCDYMPGPVLKISGDAEDALGITKSKRKDVVKFLRKKGLIKQIVIRGLVPWYDEKSGNYDFVIPNPAKIREITYLGLPRILRMGVDWTGKEGSTPRRFAQYAREKNKAGDLESRNEDNRSDEGSQTELPGL